MDIVFGKLDTDSFNEFSLDDFTRRQKVTYVWRYIDGEWREVYNPFEENWSREECREIACDIAKHMNVDQTAFAAFDGGRVIGFITVSHSFFGESARYSEIVCFQVSESYRGRGIGRKLFGLAADEALRLGADKLYISSHSSVETQAAYSALGCVHAAELNRELMLEEPFDVQLEFDLHCRDRMNKLHTKEG